MLRPIISGIASFIVPGLGQLLNRKYKRGGALVVLWLVTGTVVSVLALSLVVLVHFIFMIGTAIDAYRIAKSSTGLT